MTKAFFQKMSKPTKKNLLLDYDRSVQKSFGKRKTKAKVVLQLETQKKQTVDPMPSDHNISLQQFMAYTNLSKEQLLGKAPIKNVELKH